MYINVDYRKTGTSWFEKCCLPCPASAGMLNLEIGLVFAQSTYQLLEPQNPN